MVSPELYPELCFPNCVSRTLCPPNSVSPELYVPRTLCPPNSMSPELSPVMCPRISPDFSMRLHEELIKQGILHPEREVRSEAVLYFSRSYTDDDSIMPLVTQAIEQYGWDEAFSTAACITGLPLNDATLPWVLTQLQHEDAKKPDHLGWPDRWHTLNSLLANADAELLARHKEAILDAELLARHKQTILDVQGLEAEAVEIVAERIDLLTAGDEFCWRELEKFCAISKHTDEVDLDHAYALCEVIARKKEGYAEKVLDILGEKIEYVESNPKVRMEAFAVRMAGEMRLDVAVPLIIGKLKDADEEADLFREQCESALVKIGGDATIHAVADMFRHGDHRLRMTACHVLEYVHSDLAVNTALEFLPSEEDETVRAFLAGGLVSQFAFEAIEPVRQLVLGGDYDDSFADLKRDVVVAATLMEVEFPEREQWKAEVEKVVTRPLVADDQAVGRFDISQTRHVVVLGLCILVMAVVVIGLVHFIFPPRQYTAQERACFCNDRGVERIVNGEYDKAIADYDQALRLDPNNAAIYRNRGIAWKRKGDFDKAIADFNQALRIDVNYIAVYINRGNAWENKGDFDKAIADFNQALRLDVNYTKVYINRGWAWNGKGEYEKAIIDFNEALRLDANYAYAYGSLAWLQATCPDSRYRDGKAALKNANKAYQMEGWKNWGGPDTLAAAYAENGDFEKAREWETKAIEMATDEKSKQRCRSHLKFYKQNKPYREELKKN